MHACMSQHLQINTDAHWTEGLECVDGGDHAFVWNTTQENHKIK